MQPQNIRIINARVPLVSGGEDICSLDVVEGKIQTSIEKSSEKGDRVVDATNLLLLPGIVDVHGDAFEKQLMPRPQVFFPLEAALFETDRQLVSNGITTAFHGLTCSWEPGLRSMETARQFIEILRHLRPYLSCDHRIHIRYEIANGKAAKQVEEWLIKKYIDLFSFNDHDSRLRLKAMKPSSLSTLLSRTGLTKEKFLSMLDDFTVDDNCQQTLQHLANVCNSLQIPMASHDDPDPETRTHYHRLGSNICEFPENAETAKHAISKGNDVIMGAPNILRGKSHLGLVSARDFVQKGLCTILSSDYHYPSLLAAPFILAAEKIIPFAEAWQLVSKYPAKAVGLGDRGSLADNMRADLLLVDDQLPLNPKIVAAIINGKLQLLTEASRFECRSGRDQQVLPKITRDKDHALC